MTDALGTEELSSPATNGATGDSVSARSVGSNGGAKAIDASESTVAFLIAETNRLAKENQRLKDKLALLDVEKRLRLLEPGSTELPVCRCAAEMNLMAILPVTGGDTEIRIFRCPDCSHELRLTAWRNESAA